MNTPEEGYKQVIVIRKDLNMRKGKFAAQASHASIAGIFPREKADIKEENGQLRVSWLLSKEQVDWFMELSTKIVVYVNSEQELIDLYEKAQKDGIPTALIQDRGFTEFGGIPTYTAISVGPAEQEKVNSITGHLPLL